VVGFTGRFSEQKALHILVEAFSIVRRDVPQLRLLLVGDGGLRRDLEDQARRNGVADSVLVTGFRRDVPLLLRAMDLFMMTSLWEGLSRSLAEAMYVKLPCIATDVGGTPEAVRTGETGWLVPANNVAEAASALRDAVLHPDRAAAAAERAHAWARATFDVTTMHEKMKDLYLRLAAQDPGVNRRAMP
jgi:glycosyltransferase involved in cell wall biosynthesis